MPDTIIEIDRFFKLKLQELKYIEKNIIIEIDNPTGSIIHLPQIETTLCIQNTYLIYYNKNGVRYPMSKTHQFLQYLIQEKGRVTIKLDFLKNLIDRPKKYLKPYVKEYLPTIFILIEEYYSEKDYLKKEENIFFAIKTCLNIAPKEVIITNRKTLEKIDDILENKYRNLVNLRNIHLKNI